MHGHLFDAQLSVGCSASAETTGTSKCDGYVSYSGVDTSAGGLQGPARQADVLSSTAATEELVQSKVVLPSTCEAIRGRY